MGHTKPLQQKRVIACKRDDLLLKQAIQNWLLNADPMRPTWGQMLYDAVSRVNAGSNELKYCYFNDYHQRIFLKKDFEQWAARTRDAMKTALKHYYA